MPRITRPPEKLAPVPLILNVYHHHRLALGWLVAREAGINPPIAPLVGGAAHPMDRWSKAKKLPAGLVALQPSARLLYRLRALALILHGHPNAEICGGPERWWQFIVDEQLVANMCRSLLPVLMPEARGVIHPQRAPSAWWMRRGINPINATLAPATWALVEAAQGRIFPSRPECLRPADDAPLPLPALNGEMGVAARKGLLAKLTGCSDGYRPNTSRSIYSDWKSMLDAWQATATAHKQKQQPVRVSNVVPYEAVAIAVNDAVLPAVWDAIGSIRVALNDKNVQKPCLHALSDGFE